MPRTTPEWIAKHDDQAIPRRVRLRVFDRFGGICQLSGIKIESGDDWHLDHIKPLRDGGEHREANLQPVLAAKHRKKTSAEAAQRAVERRKRAKALGISKTKNPLPGGKGSRWKRKVGGGVVPRGE